MEPATPQERAEQLRQKYRGRWLILWSQWDSRFIAFPTWIGNDNGGRMISAVSGMDLERLMAQVEGSTPDASMALNPTQPGPLGQQGDWHGQAR